MKGHKSEHHKHRATGGANEAETDLNDKPEARVNAKKIFAEAEERKSGGRASAKCAGGAMRKEGGKVDGEHEKRRADRKPRKSGGSANATANPFSSARHGTPAKGRSVMGSD